MKILLSLSQFLKQIGKINAISLQMTGAEDFRIKSFVECIIDSDSVIVEEDAPFFGQGVSGIVAECKFKNNEIPNGWTPLNPELKGCRFVIKIFSKNCFSMDFEGSFRRFLREVCAMFNFCHPAMTEIVGWNTHSKFQISGMEVTTKKKKIFSPFIIMPMYDHSLHNHFDSNNTETKFEDILKLAYRCLRGYKYISSLGFILRDIKPANILMKGNFPYISDYGGAKLKNESFSVTITSPFYLAPELKNNGYEGNTELSDVYSFGMTLVYLLSKLNTHIKVINEIDMKRNSFTFFKKCNEEESFFKELISSMTQTKPRERKLFRDYCQELEESKFKKYIKDIKKEFDEYESKKSKLVNDYCKYFENYPLNEFNENNQFIDAYRLLKDINDNNNINININIDNDNSAINYQNYLNLSLNFCIGYQFPRNFFESFKFLCPEILEADPTLSFLNNIINKSIINTSQPNSLDKEDFRDENKQAECFMERKQISNQHFLEGISYELQNDYVKAIRSYRESLICYPQGIVSGRLGYLLLQISSNISDNKIINNRKKKNNSPTPLQQELIQNGLQLLVFGCNEGDIFSMVELANYLTEEDIHNSAIISIYERLLTIGYPYATLNLGHIYYLREDYAKSLEYYEKSRDEYGFYDETNEYIRYIQHVLKMKNTSKENKAQTNSPVKIKSKASTSPKDRISTQHKRKT